MASADYDLSPVPEYNGERRAVTSQTKGFHIRHPPKPHLLCAPITPDEDLFQTTHMGAVDVDVEKWLLVIDGLVERPFALTFTQLLKMPSSDVQSVHECFGSPLAPATNALWRVGNAVWTGVPLRTLLDIAKPLPTANFVWSDGLDSGTFADVDADRYQKDLPMSKAQSREVLVAYKMNERLLDRERGGPVRLIVPGWFGTNSTKWLCRLSLHSGRAPGPYTTQFYNSEDLDDPQHRRKPVWEIDVNSMIVRPAPNSIIHGPKVGIEGWAWSHDGVAKVEISFTNGEDWHEAQLEPQRDFRWQKFDLQLFLQSGEYMLIARAVSLDGKSQALRERRNHAHIINIKIEN
ncbi:sulfite reductase [Stagonosporopsis vannaccii]|nr:sulfite reductase [Stagonosporopsis vannaccii]